MFRGRLDFHFGSILNAEKKIDADVREIVNAAADFAQHDPEPDVAELYTDIYR